MYFTTKKKNSSKPFFASLRIIWSQALVAHACNPSYSGDRDQEDGSSKPAWANSSRDLILKKTYHKTGWWSGSSGRVPA
jgi:hypothetical protein